jgi:hypothetical protein
MDIPYCLKDLTKIYFACCGMLYGKEKQTLFIDDEPSNALRNPKWSGFFTKSFKRTFYQNISCNSWTWHLVYANLDWIAIS